MATFSTVNTALSAPTDRASAHKHASITSHPSANMGEIDESKDLNEDESSPNTPTRFTFGGLHAQQPLPSGPFISAKEQDSNQADSQNRRDSSTNDIAKIPQPKMDSDDVDMDNGEDDANTIDDDGSGNESVTSESQRPSKKKKGQRFFCTDFPPCQLSFTRSEHLARHIRKHTGERPFQCHCSRRFSRLDNLRQHAQTVHVNEEIPGDSLAAQSTRFQRQIRTDRVRPTSSRSRASTIGSQGGHSRGHSRNLSASSVGSTTSSIGISEDGRRRPQPLAMANDSPSRMRLGLDTFANTSASPGQQFTYYNPSPPGYTTPTSTNFSPGNNSPQFQSAIVSPTSNLSRSSYYASHRGHGRRLSVPSTQHPYHTPDGAWSQPYFSPIPSSSSSTMSPTNQVFASPTSSVFSHNRRESESEMDYRRRTWHPGTNSLYAQRPATSGLTYYQTPDEPRPAFSQQPAASQMTRLPGIESFDHAPPPAPRQPSPPVMTDTNTTPTTSGHQSDPALQHGLTRLDIPTANAMPDGQWRMTQPAASAQGAYYAQPGPGSNNVQPIQHHHHHMSMPEQPLTSQKHKRNAWYGGPVGPVLGNIQTSRAAIRTSPDDSGSSDDVTTPSNMHNTELNPVIVNQNGVSETYPAGTVSIDDQKAYYQSTSRPPKNPPMRSDSGFHVLPQEQLQQQSTPTQQTYALQAGHDPRLAHANYHQPPSNDMAKLEALVAVATSQNRAIEHES